VFWCYARFFSCPFILNHQNSYASAVNKIYIILFLSTNEKVSVCFCVFYYLCSIVK
jgi:hypothetical protein